MPPLSAEGANRHVRRSQLPKARRPKAGQGIVMIMMIRYPTSPLPLSTMVTTPAMLVGCLRTPLEEDNKINA